MGADKLELLFLLTKKRGFLDAFKVVLYSRENKSLEQTLNGNGMLAGHMDRIVILPQPEGTDTVSSSLARKRMLSGESCQDLLCPEVWDLFKAFTPADFPEVINQFKDEHAFLGNRFPCRFVWEGLTYGSAEAAFQASKCAEVSERKVFAKCSTDQWIPKKPAC